MISAYPFCFRRVHRPVGALYLLFTLIGPLIYNSSFTVDVISSWAILTVNLRYVVPDNLEYYSFNVPHFSKQSVPITDTFYSLNNFGEMYLINYQMRFHKCIWFIFSLKNFHDYLYVFDKLSIVYKYTTNLNRVLQMTSFLMNDNIKAINKIPLNSNCTDLIFLNLLTI